MEGVGNYHEESLLFNQIRHSEQMHTWGPRVNSGSSISQEPSFMNEGTSMNQKRNSEQLRGGGNPHVMGGSMTSINEQPSIGWGSPSINGRGNTIEENDMVVDEEPSPVNNQRGSEQMKCRGTHVSDRSMAPGGSVMVNDDEAGDTMMDLVSDVARDDNVEMENSPFTYMSSLQAQWNAEESRKKLSLEEESSAS